MCEKISFCQDKKGTIYHAGGLTYSHSEITALHKLDDDKVNKYEFNPRIKMTIAVVIFRKPNTRDKYHGESTENKINGKNHTSLSLIPWSKFNILPNSPY